MSGGEGTPALDTHVSPFRSWLMGGFEGSTIKFWDGRRIDVIASTQHDRRAFEDYVMLAGMGLLAIRDTFRWHLIEQSPARYEWSSVAPMMSASGRAGVQVIWDLCHFGAPGHVNILDPDFPKRFADFAEAAGRVRSACDDSAPWWCPVNEISYWAYAGGVAGYMSPAAPGQADCIKRNLVAASIAAMERLRAIDPRARFLIVDPLIHVSTEGGPTPQSVAECQAGLEAFDMFFANTPYRSEGDPLASAVIGVNYYPNNQWLVGGQRLPMGAVGYRPLRLLLHDVWERYRRPILLAETGTEAPNAPGWFRYVFGEVRSAIENGVPVLGMCLYPAMDYPGWTDGRQARCGVISVAGDGQRSPRHEAINALQAEFRSIRPTLRAVGLA